MQRIRCEKTKDYTVIANYAVKDKNLSLKAKGLLLTVMSLPNDWDFTVEGLTTILKEGRKAIYNIIKELIENGYCSKERIKELGKGSKSRYLGIEYSFYEERRKSTTILAEENKKKEKNGVTVPSCPFPPYGHIPDGYIPNGTQLNTNNIKYLKNKVLIDREHSNFSNFSKNEEKEKQRFIPPTLTEIKEFKDRNNLSGNADDFLDYYTSNGWMVGRSKMKDWKAAFRHWSRNEKKQCNFIKKGDKIPDYLQL